MNSERQLDGWSDDSWTGGEKLNRNNVAGLIYMNCQCSLSRCFISLASNCSRSFHGTSINDLARELDG